MTQVQELEPNFLLNAIQDPEHGGSAILNQSNALTICHVRAAAAGAATVMCKEAFGEDVWAGRAAPGAEPEPHKLAELRFMDGTESETHSDRKP